jgi:hypothetical protein
MDGLLEKDGVRGPFGKRKLAIQRLWRPLTRNLRDRRANSDLLSLSKDPASGER